MSSGKPKCLKLQRREKNLQCCTAVKCTVYRRVAPVAGVLTFPAAAAPLLGSGVGPQAS